MVHFNKKADSSFNNAFQTILKLYEKFFFNLFSYPIFYLSLDNIDKKELNRLKTFSEKEHFLLEGKTYFTIKENKDLRGFIEIPNFISFKQKNQVQRILGSIQINMLVNQNMHRIPLQKGKKEEDHQAVFLSSSSESQAMKLALEIHQSTAKNLFIQFKSLNEEIRRDESKLSQLKNTTLFIDEIQTLFPLEAKALSELIKKNKSEDILVILSSQYHLKDLFEQKHLYDLLLQIRFHHSYLYAIH